jgi:hypothetical protein
MTYLELINNVLTRLREDEIPSLDSLANDPYYKFIGTAVNDAKDRVEDAWQWSALRGSDTLLLDPAPVLQPGDFAPNFSLPNSADNHYIIKGFYRSSTTFTDPKYDPVRWTNKNHMIQLQSNGTPPLGSPTEIAVNRRDQTTGDITVVVYPTPNPTDLLIIDRVNHQPSLNGTLAVDNPDGLDRNRLKVPSLPVYTLATALASRERGEVGGTPTSELFAIADRHLADAIANDSALYADELDWWANTNESATNVRFA